LERQRTRPQKRKGNPWRFRYFPSVFFALGVGWLIADLARHSRRGALAAAGIIALAYGAIDLAAIDEWIDASRLAGRLAGELRATVGSVPAGDTLRFLTIPGKVAGTPVLNLGFAGTVRHMLDRDDVIVLIGSKLNMREHPTRIDVGRDGGLTLHAARGGHFTVTSRALSARQRAPAPGDTLETELGPVVVDGVDETRRATGLRFQLARDSQRGLYTFDGERFRRVD
jgi:hypothetical protein